MKNLIYTTLISLLLFSACAKDNDKPATPDTQNNYVNLKSPLQGQKNMYLRYTKACGENDTFLYTGDTLLLSVLETDTATLLQESFTTGSVNFSSWPDAHYAIQANASYILIPHRENSTLFYFYGNDTIFFNNPPTLELTQQNCDLIDQDGNPFIGEEIGSLTNYLVGEIVINDKLAVSCVPPILNLDGFLIYDSEGLAVSSTNEFFANQVNGWVWIK